jgi:hypothetical protein
LKGLGYILGAIFANSSGHPDMLLNATVVKIAAHTKSTIEEREIGRKCFQKVDENFDSTIV